MSALPSSIPSNRDRANPRAAELARRRQALKTANRSAKEVSVPKPRTNDYAARVWESSLVLGMNGVLIGTALVTLAHLVPYQLNQRAKLKEISREEIQVAQSLQQLQQTYKRSQSPETAQRIAQEQGSLMRADQLKVFQIPQSTPKVQ